MAPLSNVIKYFPLGVCRKFAPPPSLALTLPEINCGSLVNVKVALAVTGTVAVGVEGVGLSELVAVVVAVGVSVAVKVMVAVDVTVTVPCVDVAERVSDVVGVFDAVGLLVVVAVRLGVREGMGVGSTVSVGAGVEVAAMTGVGDGNPDPIKMTRIPPRSRSVIPLKMIPCVVGRSLMAKRVSKPRTLASAKWTANTKMPWGQMPATPEPSPKPPALIGR